MVQKYTGHSFSNGSSQGQKDGISVIRIQENMSLS